LWQKEIGTKAAHKKLVKLATGVNFTNVLQADFRRADPKSAKKTVKLSSFFVLLGSASIKAACRMLVKLTLGLNLIKYFGLSTNFFLLSLNTRLISEFEEPG